MWIFDIFRVPYEKNREYRSMQQFPRSKTTKIIKNGRMQKFHNDNELFAKKEFFFLMKYPKQTIPILHTQIPAPHPHSQRPPTSHPLLLDSLPCLKFFQSSAKTADENQFEITEAFLYQRHKTKNTLFQKTI